MMNFIVENWTEIIFLLASIGVIAFFFTLPSATQKKKINEWLLWAVCEAEKELGSKTGALKLRFVYDMFISKFPVISKLISFAEFSDLVDEALAQMESLLKNNEALQNYING